MAETPITERAAGPHVGHLIRRAQQIHNRFWNDDVSEDVTSPQFVLLLLAGSLSFVEPFWLAALTAGVRGARARESGEDLFARFAELREGDAGGEEAA